MLSRFVVLLLESSDQIGDGTPDETCCTVPVAGTWLGNECPAGRPITELIKPVVYGWGRAYIDSEYIISSDFQSHPIPGFPPFHFPSYFDGRAFISKKKKFFFFFHAASPLMGEREGEAVNRFRGWYRWLYITRLAPLFRAPLPLAFPLARPPSCAALLLWELGVGMGVGMADRSGLHRQGGLLFACLRVRVRVCWVFGWFVASRRGREGKGKGEGKGGDLGA